MPNLILRLNLGDTVIDRSTVILSNSTGSEVVTPVTNAHKIALVNTGETLIINAHGSSDSCGGYSHENLAAFLAKHGLRTGANIEIIACETGFGGSPYALNLKTELVQGHKIICKVTAPTRYVAINDDSSKLVCDATFAVNGDVTSVTPVVEGTQLINTPWGTRKVNKTTDYKT